MASPVEHAQSDDGIGANVETNRPSIGSAKTLRRGLLATLLLASMSLPWLPRGLLEVVLGTSFSALAYGDEPAPKAKPKKSASNKTRPKQAAARKAAANPTGLVTNGSFESTMDDTDLPMGWYYARQGRVVADDSLPEGKRCLTFTNTIPGREAQAQQLLRIDGQKVSLLDVTAWIRTRGVEPGQTNESRAQCLIAFYDQKHALLDEYVLCAYFGNVDWTETQGQVNVPNGTKTALIWLGLMGAVGEVSFDDVQILPIEINPSVLTPKPKRKNKPRAKDKK